MIALNTQPTTPWALIQAGFAIVFLLVFASMAHADWDDEIVNFVDSDVPKLTKEYAETDLYYRWIEVYLSPIAQAAQLESEITRRLQTFVFPTVMEQLDVPTSIAILKTLDANIAAIRFDQSRIEAAISQISSLKSACDRATVYANPLIQSVGALAILNVTLPDRPPVYVLYLNDPYYITTIVTAGISLYRYLDDREKRRRAEDALGRLPGRIISADWIVERSKQICNETRAARMGAVESYVQTLHNFAKQLSGYEERLWKLYHRIEAIIGKASFIDVLKRSGVWEAEITRENNLASSRVRVDLELALNEISQLEKRAIAANGCTKGISSVETYEDALFELKSQIDVLVSMPQLPITLARLNSAGKQISAKLATVDLKYQTARNRLCIAG